MDLSDLPLSYSQCGFAEKLRILKPQTRRILTVDRRPSSMSSSTADVETSICIVMLRESENH
jgi:hypothetical protein